MTVPSNPLPVARTDENRNNILSIFSPMNVPSPIPNNADPNNQMLGAFLTNGEDMNGAFDTAHVDEASQAADGSKNTRPAAIAASNEAAAASHHQLGFLDEDLPLLSDSEHYNFNEGEQQAVMKKLEDFESSLLDEYDVNCLDTLLQVCCCRA
ncbi:hypothetical protein BBJ28_00001195 [Nothophytophthora sp. Chile5]|nr:hypothetical protein BBJ28_00001195 [Nothophytophthora sp. Chile5]